MAIIITFFWVVGLMTSMYIKRKYKFPLVVRHCITVMEGLITCSSFIILAVSPSSTTNCHENGIWMAAEMSAMVIIKMYDEYKYTIERDNID